MAKKILAQGLSSLRLSLSRAKCGMREYTEQSQSPREFGVHTHGWDFLRSMPTVAFHTISKPLQVPQQRLAVQFQQEAPEDPRLCQRFHRPQQMSQARVPKSLC